MRTTLDEGAILHAGVQLGGFAPAAKQLNRSQSTISYAISRLQDQLRIKLFEIKGRRAHLTEMVACYWRTPSRTWLDFFSLSSARVRWPPAVNRR